MPTIFTRIIDGEIPGRFVHSDDACVAFMDVRPLAPGHVLVVPRTEVDHWTDLDADTAAHLMMVAQRIGRAQRDLLSPARVGLMIAGFEVPHVHVHVVPMNSMGDLDFSRAEPNPDQADVERIHAVLSAALAG
ncbi:MAG: HIT family protein [Acidimicrobiales bacterium]|nr:HIT family protein [Acidimicrobiales bacterium]MDG1878789.1 HIT family protein [Acidimicrobiales bacterium]